MDRIMLSDEQARLLRLRSQRLDRRGRPAPGAVGTVHQLCGVHAQLPSASALTLRPRTTGLAAADVERARVDERALRIIRLALDRDGALTRPELAERLAVAGVDPSGQRIAHLVHRAGLEGLVCHGPDRGAEPTFVLLEDWLGAAPARTGPLDREVALGELARRYLAAYAPAGPRDLAWWSGLEPREARAAWSRVAGELIEVEVAGEPAWLLASRADWLADPGPEGPLVHLLPGFDVLMLGYRSRALAVPQEHARAVWTAGGFIKPTLVVDGRAVATWSSSRRARRLEVTVEPFAGLPHRVHAGLQAEVADLGRFLGTATALAIGGTA